MESKNRKIMRVGSGLVVYLNTELSKLNLKKGDTIKSYFDTDKIILTGNSLSVFRPFGISYDLWKEFCSYAIREGNENYDESIIKALEEALKIFIKEKTEKYILKIKTGIFK